MNNQIGGNQPLSNLTRTYYFQGELLGNDDFIRDQQYIRDLSAVQNQCLYAPGVVQGLALSISGSVLTASPGLAFDAYGVPIVAGSQVTRDLSGDSLAAGIYYVGLLYGDSLTAQTSPSSLEDNHLIIETPTLIPPVATPPAAPTIVLGQVTVAAGGAYTLSTTGRQLAHGLLPGPAPSAAAHAASPDASFAAISGAALSAGHVGRLQIGAEPAEAIPAPFSVVLDLAAGGSDQAAGMFELRDGDRTLGSVALGSVDPTGAHWLLDVTYDGKRIWGVDVTGAAFSISDAAAKTHIVPLVDALGMVERMTGVSYTLRSSGNRRVGLLADEVAAALPDAIRRDPGGAQAVCYDAVVGVLVEAVKTLSARLDTLTGTARA